MSKIIRYMLYNILVVILFSCVSKTHDTNDVLEILSATIDENNEIKLSVQITNKEDSITFFYVPDMEDACNNMLQFYLIDKEGIQHYYDVCDSDEQLDEIVVTDKNSRQMKKGENAQIDFSISLSSFTPKLSRESVDEIKCVIDYSGVNWVGSNNTYQEKIESKIKF